MIKQTINMELITSWDGENDIWRFKLSVPDSITDEYVRNVITDSYKRLKNEDETTSIVDVMDCICAENNWNWEDFDYDISINFNELN